MLLKAQLPSKAPASVLHRDSPTQLSHSVLHIQLTNPLALPQSFQHPVDCLALTSGLLWSSLSGFIDALGNHQGHLPSGPQPSANQPHKGRG